MKNIILFIIIISLNTFCFSQTTNPNKLTKRYVDSTFRSNNFLALIDAERIIEKPAILKDSVFKLSDALLRYMLTYVAIYKDSTSKGRIFFDFEQYTTSAIAKDIYQSAKTESEKEGIISVLTDAGSEGYIIKDKSNYPFILIRKENKIFKFKLYYLTNLSSQAEFLKAAKRIVASH